jgi:hypothetical protein
MLRRWILPAVVVILAAAGVAAVLEFLPLPRDGSSPRRAVVLHVPEDKTTDAEWEWWQKKYPDAGLLLHAMTAHKGEIYSRYYLSTPSGERNVWFATNMRNE